MRFRLYTFSLLSFLRQRLGKYGWAKKLGHVKLWLPQLLLLHFSGIVCYQMLSKKLERYITYVVIGKGKNDKESFFLVPAVGKNAIGDSSELRVRNRRNWRECRSQFFVRPWVGRRYGTLHYHRLHSWEPLTIWVNAWNWFYCEAVKNRFHFLDELGNRG